MLVLYTACAKQDSNKDGQTVIFVLDEEKMSAV